MQLKPLKIAGAWEIIPQVFPDSRGEFWENFKASTYLPDLAQNFTVEQVNCSISKANVIRGIHYTKDLPGQSKLVSAVSGIFIDVIVDLRLNSKTFLQWEKVQLDTATKNSVFLTAGLGHAVLALQDNSTLVYLCSAEYNPVNEFGINPWDSQIAIPWTDFELIRKSDFILSEKDSTAPTVTEAKKLNILPN